MAPSLSRALHPAPMPSARRTSGLAYALDNGCIAYAVRSRRRPTRTRPLYGLQRPVDQPPNHSQTWSTPRFTVKHNNYRRGGQRRGIPCMVLRFARPVSICSRRIRSRVESLWRFRLLAGSRADLLGRDRAVGRHHHHRRDGDHVVLRSIVPGSRPAMSPSKRTYPPPTGPARLVDSPRDSSVYAVIGHFRRPIWTGTDLVQIIRYRNNIDRHATQRDKCNYFPSFPADDSEAHRVNRACRSNDNKMKKTVFFTRQPLRYAKCWTWARQGVSNVRVRRFDSNVERFYFYRNNNVFTFSPVEHVIDTFII